MTRLLRFLVLGSEGGTYYACERALTEANAEAVARLIHADGPLVVATARSISITNRAAKVQPTLFVLAMAARLGDAPTRKAAYATLPQIARTPTMLFEWITYSQALTSSTGWGRGAKRAIATIYGQKTPKSLAYWATKYRKRGGWSHRDVLLLAHVKPSSIGHQLVQHYIVTGELADELAHPEDAAFTEAWRFLAAVEEARKSTSPETVAGLIKQHGLVREHVPTKLLNSVVIWRALLQEMPPMAMIRNLAKMTAVGLLNPLSSESQTVCRKLSRRLAMHPMAILVALKTYQRGTGVRGHLTWMPNLQIVSALNAAFYTAFQDVRPTNKRFLLALDVSGSMDWSDISNTPGVTPRVAAAAMAMVTMRSEPHTHIVAFAETLKEIAINAAMSLDEVIAVTARQAFGATDCAQPMLWALKKKVKVDVFIIYTDSEVNCGATTAKDALDKYRRATKIDAKLIVVAMTSGGFTLADPSDAGMLDVVGFDTNVPTIIRDFIA